MTRLEFYKFYWDKTIRKFPDHGYRRVINKRVRLPITIICYLMLIMSWLFLLIDVELWMRLIVIAFIWLLSIFQLDYSVEMNIIAIEKLYRLSKKNDVYSMVLISIFRSDKYTFCRKYLSNIKNLKLSWMGEGLSSNCLRYIFIVDYFDNKLKIILSEKKIKLVYKDKIKIFNKNYLTIKDLFDDIRVYLTSLNE